MPGSQMHTERGETVSRFRRPIVLTVLISILAAAGFSVAVYANGLTGKDVDTQPFFHLTAEPLELCRNPNTRENLLKETCVGEETHRNVISNLFTFTHPDTPNEAKIIEWTHTRTVTPDKRGKITGSFAIDVDLPGQSFGDAVGQIFVSFNAKASYVPQVTEEPRHYNFEGPFKVTGGTGFYEGIIGNGTIGGTFHAHRWGEGVADDEVQGPWFDFVMIGTAKFP